MNLQPIVLHAPLTTHHTLETCLQSFRVTDRNLKAAKELQAELAKYIASFSAADAASKTAPRKSRPDTLGLFSLTKDELVLVMGYLERVRYQAILPSSRAMKDIVAPSPRPPPSPPLFHFFY